MFRTTRIARCLLLGFVFAAFQAASCARSQTFKAGFASQDITPTQATPMWGYGARHDKLSTGVIDRLQAKACVIETGRRKLAIVGLDLRCLGEKLELHAIVVVLQCWLLNASVQH